jgi:type IV secretory pathway VirJ component
MDLPIVEVPAAAGGDELAVLVSGDGGWAHTDKVLARALAEHGVPVVGLNSLRYFWKRRTPDESAAALELILRHYLAEWHRQRVILLGFSRGSVVSAIHGEPATNRPSLSNRRAGAAEPKSDGDFEFHVSDWLGAGSDKDGLPVQPELEKLAGMNLLCFYGEDDADAVETVQRARAGPRQAVSTERRHHFEDSYDKVAGLVLEEFQHDAGGQPR